MLQIRSPPRGSHIARKWSPAAASKYLTPGGLFLSLGLASLPIGSWDHEFSDTAHLMGNELVWWTLVSMLLLYVKRIERRPLSSIGLKAVGVKALALGVALGVLTIAVLGLLYLEILPALHLDDQVAASPNAAALMATPFWWRLLSTIRAAVAEEILYRGYPMERIEEMTGSKIAAILVSCAAFTAAHLSTWGLSHTLIVGVAGLAFALAYLWRRNLWVNIIAHFMVDAVSVLI